MTSRLSFFISSALATLLSSCASYQLPKDYAGPTALIRSTGKGLNSVKGEGYYIEEVNGKFVQHSPMATPRGAGIRLAVDDRTLRVPCEPLDLKLRGGNIYAADGVQLADSMIGGNHQVTGKITFTPKPNGDYSVYGVTGKDRTAVWIEDTKTGKIASSTIEK